MVGPPNPPPPQYSPQFALTPPGSMHPPHVTSMGGVGGGPPPAGNWEDHPSSEHESAYAAATAGYPYHGGGIVPYHPHPGVVGHPGHHPGAGMHHAGMGQGGGPPRAPTTGGGGGNRTPRGRSLKGRKMSLAAFPNRGHLLVDENAEFAQNDDRTTYLLSTPPDADSLSDRQCYVRSHFVELFVADASDVSARHSRGAQKLHVGQIGLRCAYCVKLKPRDRAERAICYPSSISRIYQTVADMQRFHFESCVAIPPKVLRTYKGLKTTRPRGVGSPQSYWDRSARDIGLVDTEEGIQVDTASAAAPGGVGGGEGRLAMQKKSPVTGMLERLDVPSSPRVKEEVLGDREHSPRQGMPHDQGMMQGHEMHPHPMQGGRQQVFVKDEQVELGAPIHQAPRGAQVTPSRSAGPQRILAVVSSPGSDNHSKDEDEHGHHHQQQQQQQQQRQRAMMGHESGPAPATPKQATANEAEAEEDANILLMLKKTPESPPGDDNIVTATVAV